MGLVDVVKRLVEAHGTMSGEEKAGLIAQLDDKGSDEQPAEDPAAVAYAEATGVDLSTVEGTGAGGTITKADVADAAEAADADQ